MRLELTGRHVPITPAVRTIVEKQLAATHRLLNDSVVSVQVVLSKEKLRFRAEVTVHARGDHFLHGAGVGRGVATAMGAAMAKIELDYPQTFFTDYFNLLKVDGKWMIVNKTFHARRKA